MNFDPRCYDLAWSFLLLKDNIPQKDFKSECEVLAQLLQDVMQDYLKKVDERA